jgi:uncharacterized membrane protein
VIAALPEYVNAVSVFHASLILFLLFIVVALYASLILFFVVALLVDIRLIPFALVSEYRRVRRSRKETLFTFIVVGMLATIATTFLLTALYFIWTCTVLGGCS